MEWIECPECGAQEFRVSRDYSIRCADCGWNTSLHRRPDDDHRPIDRSPSERQPDRDDVYWFE